MSLLFEICGPFNVTAPVHENLTLLALRQAIETSQAGGKHHKLGDLLKSLVLMKLPNWTDKDYLDPTDAPTSAQEFLRGVVWPDDPKCWLFDAAIGTTNYSSGVDWGVEFKMANHTNRGNLIARSHFGDLQFFHAMATSHGESAKDTKEKMIQWARLNVELSLGSIRPDTQIKDIAEDKFCIIKEIFSAHKFWSFRQLFSGQGKWVKEVKDEHIQHRAVGILLHMIQDSFAEGHAERENGSGAILQFHEYSSQDSHKHGSKDQFGPGTTLKQRLEKTSGAMPAIQAGAQVVLMIDRRDSVETIKKHLDEQVFRLSDNASAAGPGEEFEKSWLKTVSDQLKITNQVPGMPDYKKGKVLRKGAGK